MNDSDLYTGTGWEFDRQQRNAENDLNSQVIDVETLCNNCELPYEREDMRSGICEHCESLKNETVIFIQH